MKGTGVHSSSLDGGLGRVGEEQIICALFVFDEGFGTFDAFLYRHFKRVLLDARADWSEPFVFEIYLGSFSINRTVAFFATLRT